MINHMKANGIKDLKKDKANIKIKIKYFKANLITNNLNNQNKYSK